VQVLLLDNFSLFSAAAADADSVAFFAFAAAVMAAFFIIFLILNIEFTLLFFLVE